MGPAIPLIFGLGAAALASKKAAADPNMRYGFGEGPYGDFRFLGAVGAIGGAMLSTDADTRNGLMIAGAALGGSFVTSEICRRQAESVLQQQPQPGMMFPPPAAPAAPPPMQFGPPMGAPAANNPQFDYAFAGWGR